jgi:hypothetical protein
LKSFPKIENLCVALLEEGMASEAEALRVRSAAGLEIVFSLNGGNFKDLEGVDKLFDLDSSSS